MDIMVTLTDAEQDLLLANEYGEHENWPTIAAKIRAGKVTTTIEARTTDYKERTRSVTKPDDVRTYTHSQVIAAINQACDDITSATELPESGTIDALNLLVNAATAYLDGSATNLGEVAAANYDAPLDEILEW